MKKIDLNKSLIFGREYEDAKNSLEYLEQEGYFSNSEDFSEYKEAKLDLVEVSNVTNFMFSPYKFLRDGFRYSFSYFIPKSKAAIVEEEHEKKKLRPLKSIDEFFAVTGFKIGDIVQIKKFGNYNYEEKSIFSGIRVYIDEEFHGMVAIFGASTHSFDDLFKRFKFFKNGEWFCFGVEE